MESIQNLGFLARSVIIQNKASIWKLQNRLRESCDLRLKTSAMISKVTKVASVKTMTDYRLDTSKKVYTSCIKT